MFETFAVSGEILS